MIINLRETTQKNAEQDWLKTNLAKFSSMMQGQKNLETVSRLIMSELTPLVSAHHGAFFMMDWRGQRPDPEADVDLRVPRAQERRQPLPPGRGPGRPVRAGEEDHPAHAGPARLHPHQLGPGRGAAAQHHRAAGAVRGRGQGGHRAGLVPRRSAPIHQLFLDQLTESIGVVLNMISANMRTEELLQQSQSLTQELQSSRRSSPQQQDELKRTNSALEKQALELEEKARLLAEQNTKVEVKNREVEQARAVAGGEGRAARADLQVQVRVPRQHVATSCARRSTACSSSPSCSPTTRSSNLTDKQVEYAKTIYASGGDLLDADQRDPRPVQGRGRQDAGRAARHRARRPRRLRRAQLPAGRRAEGPRVQDRRRRRRCRRTSAPIRSGCSRCSRTCSPTPSSSPSAAR